MALLLNSNNLNDDVDLENQEYESFSKNLRMGFIRRVYGLVLLQLIVDMLLCVSVILIKPLRTFLILNINIVMISTFVYMAITSIIYILIYFKPDLLTKHPTNIIIFSILTLCEGLLLSNLCLVVPVKYILMALTITIIVVVSLTIYSFQTKYDFTSHMSILLYGSIAFMAVSFIYLFFPKIRIIELILAPIGAIFFSFGLIVTTQSVIGNGKHFIYEDDYISAALLIHTQIIDIFVYILRFILALNKE